MAFAPETAPPAAITPNWNTAHLKDQLCLRTLIYLSLHTLCNWTGRDTRRLREWILSFPETPEQSETVKREFLVPTSLCHTCLCSSWNVMNLLGLLAVICSCFEVIFISWEDSESYTGKEKNNWRLHGESDTFLHVSKLRVVFSWVDFH